MMEAGSSGTFVAPELQDVASKENAMLCVLSGFRLEVTGNCALLRYAQRVQVIYRRFGTTYPSHLQGSRTGWSETSVRN
jgi:hypothetical protein